MSQTTWLLKEVSSLTTEYHTLCNSINFFDLRFESRKFAVSRAFTLNSLKAFCLEVVASVCNSIARFILSTRHIGLFEVKYNKEVMVLIPPPIKIGGLLSTRL